MDFIKSYILRVMARVYKNILKNVFKTYLAFCIYKIDIKVIIVLMLGIIIENIDKEEIH